jgi:hypothetical protein
MIVECKYIYSIVLIALCLASMKITDTEYCRGNESILKPQVWQVTRPVHFSASLTMCSIFSLNRWPLPLVIVVWSDLLVILSETKMSRMLFVSMSKVAWRTTQRGGGIPESSNSPRRLLWLVLDAWCAHPHPRKYIKLVTSVCRGLRLLIRMNMLRLMRAVMTLPAISITSKGATPRRRSRVLSDVSLGRIAAWTAAP